MSRTAGSNPYAIEARQSRVQRMMYAGYSIAEMGGELDCSPATIKRDLRVMKRRQLEDTKDSLTVQEMRMYMYGQHQENLRRLDEIYSDGTNREKLVATMARRREVTEFVKLLQSIGELPRAADELHITSTVALGYQGLPDEIRQQLRAAMMRGDREQWRALAVRHLGYVLPAVQHQPEETEYEDVTDDVVA